MARRKRTSPSIERAQQRADGLASIGPSLKLGENLSLAGFQATIDALIKKLSDYNTKLGELDGDLNDLKAAEAALDELTTTMLSAVGVAYGKNSTEYEKAGGTRTDERKSPAKKTKTAPLSAVK
jgi:hypothetical protein